MKPTNVFDDVLAWIKGEDQWEGDDPSYLIKDGFKIESLEEGDNLTVPKQGQYPVVHYTGTLENGTVFDSSYKRSQPFKFKLGAKQVISCWDVGVSMMSKG